MYLPLQTCLVWTCWDPVLSLLRDQSLLDLAALVQDRVLVLGGRPIVSLNERFWSIEHMGRSWSMSKGSEYRGATILVNDWIIAELLRSVFYCAVWSDDCVQIENMAVMEVDRVLLGVNTFNKW